jgi:hypothetical protein
VATNAQQKRYDAINSLVCDFAGNETYFRTFDLLGNPELGPTEQRTIEHEIKKLATLGRTERWHNAINQWAAMVREDSDPKHIMWAVYQGGIFAAHAAS